MADPRENMRKEDLFPADEFGIGILSDGTLNVVTPEEAAYRGLMRDLLDDDYSDLSDEEIEQAMQEADK